MSLICRMVVGYFDPAQVYEGFGRDIAVYRPLHPEIVGQLQSACDRLFGFEFRLADYLTEPGVLVIEGGVITEDMFRVACVAHEIFGMTAVDNAHRGVVYPRPDREPESLESSVLFFKKLRPDWEEACVRQEAESWHQWLARQAEFERGVVQRVRAARQQK